MTVAGIIAEYNPFHNGHFHHLCETAKHAPDGVVVVLGGNFTQRADAALLGKRARAEMALRGGADLVLELPVPFATAGAQRFAFGGVSVLEALGFVNVLSFGSEGGSIELLTQAADAVLQIEGSEAIRAELQSGKTFAAAREQAVRALCGDAVADVLRAPNNTLAVEYLRAMRALSSSMRAVTVLRQGAGHDSDLPSDHMACAGFLRTALRAGKDISVYLPPFSTAVLQQAVAQGAAPADFQKLDMAMLAFLRRSTPVDFAEVPDVSEGIENRILSAARRARNLTEVFDAAKTKRYTHARIRRVVLCAFLGIRNEHLVGGVPYLRVLGFSERGKTLLRTARKTAKLPIVMRASDVQSLSKSAQQIFALECTATDIFNLCLPEIGASGTEMTDNQKQI